MKNNFFFFLLFDVVFANYAHRCASANVGACPSLVSTPLDSKGVETPVEKVFLAEANGHPTRASQAVAGSLDARLRSGSDSKNWKCWADAMVPRVWAIHLPLSWSARQESLHTEVNNVSYHAPLPRKVSLIVSAWYLPVEKPPAFFSISSSPIIMMVCLFSQASLAQINLNLPCPDHNQMSNRVLEETWNLLGSSIAQVGPDGIGASGSGTSGISTTGWTALLPPMVKLSICCRSLVATCFLAPLFVARIIATTILMCNQNGWTNPKKTPETICPTIPKTMEKFRLKNGILLTMKPTEQTGWMIVEAGRMTRAQISEVTIAKAARLLEKTRNIVANMAILMDEVNKNLLSLSSGSNKLPDKKCTLSKTAPGSMRCANRKKDAM